MVIECMPKGVWNQPRSLEPHSTYRITFEANGPAVRLSTFGEDIKGGNMLTATRDYGEFVTWVIYFATADAPTLSHFEVEQAERSDTPTLVRNLKVERVDRQLNRIVGGDFEVPSFTFLKEIVGKTAMTFVDDPLGEGHGKVAKWGKTDYGFYAYARFTKGRRFTLSFDHYGAAAGFHLLGIVDIDDRGRQFFPATDRWTHRSYTFLTPPLAGVETSQDACFYALALFGEEGTYIDNLSLYEEPSVEELTLSQYDWNPEVGEALTLSYTLTPSDVPVQGGDLVWSSDDPDVVSVDEQGHLRANGWGETTIRLQNRCLKAVCRCTVRDDAFALPPLPHITQTHTESENPVMYGDFTLCNHRHDEMPTAFDYSLAVVGDMQVMTYMYPDKLHHITDWLIDNRERYNIRFAMNLGDITEHNFEHEWSLAAGEVRRLAAHIPTAIVRGNHDVLSSLNRELGDLPSSGAYPEGTIDNTYHLFEVGEHRYLVLALDFGPAPEVLDWAESVCAAHPDRRILLITHGYTDGYARVMDEDSAGSPHFKGGHPHTYGSTIWERIVRRYPNVMLAVGGHVVADYARCDIRRGKYGQPVLNMVSNPQTVDEQITPSGIVTMLFVSNDGNTLTIQDFSTVEGRCYGPTTRIEYG